MTRVYDVYTHKTKPVFGVSPDAGEVHFVQINPDGEIKEKRLDPIRLGTEIAARIRMGYRKSPRGKYLAIQTQGARVLGEFVLTHPDLHHMGGVELILFATKPIGGVPEQTYGDWETMLSRVSGVSFYLAEWLRRQKSASTYITAPATHPAFALVLAHWAIESRQVLMPSKADMPEQKPSIDPIGWKQFLAQWFDEKTIQKTLEELCWSMRDALALTSQAIIEDDSHDESWIAQAGSSAF